MNIKYSISELTNNKYELRYYLHTPDNRDMLYTSSCSFVGFKLSVLLQRAKGVIYSRVYSMYKQAGYDMPAVDIMWDESVSNLPSLFARQYHKGKLVYTPAYPAMTATPEQAEPAVFEVVMITQDGHSFPTVIKHDQPLLTWEDACKQLKEKVDSK